MRHSGQKPGYEQALSQLGDLACRNIYVEQNSKTYMFPTAADSTQAESDLACFYHGTDVAVLGKDVGQPAHSHRLCRKREPGRAGKEVRAVLSLPWAKASIRAMSTHHAIQLQLSEMHAGKTCRGTTSDPD